MAAPIFVQHAQSANFTASAATKTVSITVVTGDLIVVSGIGANANAITFGLPTNDGTALTWTSRVNVGGVSNARAAIWTATADSSRTIVVTGSESFNTHPWGISARVWRASDGVGNTGSGTGVTTAGNFSAAITTTQANSAVEMAIADFNAVGGAFTYITATAGTFTERVEVDAPEYFGSTGYYEDTGTAAAKTVGASGPAGMDVNLAAVEIKGTAAAAGDPSIARLAKSTPGLAPWAVRRM